MKTSWPRSGTWPKISRGRRSWLWVCRHPLLAVGALLGALLLLAADWLTLASVRAQQVELAATDEMTQAGYIQ